MPPEVRLYVILALVLAIVAAVAIFSIPHP
jgi:hypothetical protein